MSTPQTSEFRRQLKLQQAAPDLLAALQDAASVLAGLASGDIKRIRPDCAALAQARQAIAKAIS